MSETTQHHRVAEVARALIEEIAPQEAPLFRATSAAYFKNPRRALGGRSGRDEMLGFGGGEGATFLTPIILIAATKVVEFATEPVPETPKHGLSGLLGSFMKKRQQKDDLQSLPPLTPEKVAQARDVAITALRQHNFPEDKLDVVADALVAKLAATAS